MSTAPNSRTPSKLEQELARQAGAVVATRERTPYEVFRGQIEKLRPEIASMVGKDGVDRFVRVCLNAVQANPDVLGADRRSLLLSCMRAAQDRLMPDNREAVLNIYKTKVKKGNREEWVPMVQYLPMVQGLVKKLYDSGHVVFVDAVAVYEKDDFDYQRGDEPRIVHKPYAGDEPPGKVVAAYMVAKLKNGETKREVMFRRDIELVREKSRAKDGLMWGDFYDQAAIKSVIKRAYKQIPNHYEFDSVVAADNAATGIVVEGEHFVPSQDLDALVDGRLQAELRDEALGGRVVEAEKVETAASSANAAATGTATTGPTKRVDTAKGGTTDKPAPPEGERERLVKSIKESKDTEVMALSMDGARGYAWDPADWGVIQAAYAERLSELTGGN